jgi:hypothetical protein
MYAAPVVIHAVARLAIALAVSISEAPTAANRARSFCCSHMLINERAQPLMMANHHGAETRPAKAVNTMVE